MIMDNRKATDLDLIDRSALTPDLGDATVEDGTVAVHYSGDSINSAPRIHARPKIYADSPYDSLTEYITELEIEYYSGKHSEQPLDKILTTMYALYKSAWAVGELSWDSMFYAYADFVTKLLGIR